MSRVDKLDSLLQKEISSIIQFDLNNPEIGFVTVSEVRVSPDLSKARVYVSFFGKNYGIAALKKSKGFVRSELAKLNLLLMIHLKKLIESTKLFTEKIND